MARSHSPEALQRLGFTLQAVKSWREREHQAGRPSGLDDFYRAHQICFECEGHGTLVCGVRWRNADGTEQSERGPVAVLVERHHLENPQNWLYPERKWDYLHEACVSCGGSGTLT